MTRAEEKFTEFVSVLKEICDSGHKDPMRNREVAASRLGLTPGSFDQKLRVFRQERPQAKLLPLEEYFISSRRGRGRQAVSEQDLDDMYTTVLAKVLGVTIEEIQEKLPEAEKELEVEKKKRKELEH